MASSGSAILCGSASDADPVAAPASRAWRPLFTQPSLDTSGVGDGGLSAADTGSTAALLRALSAVEGFDGDVGGGADGGSAAPAPGI